MKTLIFGIFALLTVQANAQFTLFKTYDDYLNQTGTLYNGEIVKFKENKVEILDNNVKTSYKFDDYWGFEYKGNLFRKDKYLLMVIVQGPFCYYENGLAHMEYLVNNIDPTFNESTRRCFISKDLTTRPLLMIKKGPISEDREELNQFKEDNPQLKGYFECIESADVNVYYLGGPTKTCALEILEEWK